MNLPDSIPHSIKCPICYSLESNIEANLEWQNQNGNEYLSYYCDNCKNGWTSDESDEISLSKRLSMAIVKSALRHHKSKKRSLLRKEKIKKL